MSIKDIFDYDDRWDSVGFDCSHCKYKNDGDWPDIKKEYYCKKHMKYLTVVLDIKGFQKGEWFCKSFMNDGNANKRAFEKFNLIKKDLDEGVLYGFYGKNGCLKEIPFSNMKNVGEK